MTDNSTSSVRRLLAALLMVMGLACWSVAPTLRDMGRQWNAHTSPSWVGLAPGVGDIALPHYDLDTWLIHGGLVSAPRLQDTMRWWIGPWAGQIPFYRPISSMVFWLQWKVFGDREIRYLPISVALHLLVIYQLIRVAMALARHFRTPSTEAVLLVGAVFVTGLIILPYQSEVNRDVFLHWKNEPDTLCTLFLLLCLQSYLTAIWRAEKGPIKPQSAPVGNRLLTQLRCMSKHWLPLVWYLAACASKETGVFLPLLLSLLEWPAMMETDHSYRKAAILRLLPLLAALPLFLLFRACCLHTATGYTYGSNRAWRDRLMADVLGTVSQALAHGDLLPIGVSVTMLIVLGAVAVRRQRNAHAMNLAELCVWVFAATGLLWLMLFWSLGSQLFNSVGFAGALWMASEPACSTQVLSVSLTLVAVFGAIRQSPRLVLFSYGWVLLCLIINAFSPPVMHRYYLTDAGFALLTGMGLSFWLARIKLWFIGLRHFQSKV